MSGVHPPEDVEDALNQLDTRIPLLYSELRVIVQGLWDSAFREGARQGRQAGVEAVQAEYRDPTEAIREKLAEKARARNGL